MPPNWEKVAPISDRTACDGMVDCGVVTWPPPKRNSASSMTVTAPETICKAPQRLVKLVRIEAVVGWVDGPGLLASLLVSLGPTIVRVIPVVGSKKVVVAESSRSVV